MKLLLDTHVLIWFATDVSRLPAKVLRALLDPANVVLLSHISVLKMEIKVQTGKLHLQKSIDEIVGEQLRVNGLTELPLTLRHINGLRALAPIHRDPFDRLLISQTICEQAVIVTADHAIQQYPVSIFWN